MACRGYGALVEWRAEGEKRSAWTKTCHNFTLPSRRTGGLKYVLGRFSIIILTYFFLLAYLLFLT